MCPICEILMALEEFDACPNCGFKFEHDYPLSSNELQEVYLFDNDCFWSGELE